MAWRVLVVEGHPLSLELVTEFLEQEGCQVLTALTAEEALPRFHRAGEAEGDA